MERATLGRPEVPPTQNRKLLATYFWIGEKLFYFLIFTIKLYLFFLSGVGMAHLPPPPLVMSLL